MYCKNLVRGSSCCSEVQLCPTLCYPKDCSTPDFPAAAAAAKSLQSCPTLCDPRDGSPPGSPIPGILQARTLKWVAISFSNAWKWKVKVKSLSHVQLLATPWTAAHQAPLSMGFSRQEYWKIQTSCPSLSPRVYSDSCPLSQWCHTTISSSATLCSFCLVILIWQMRTVRVRDIKLLIHSCTAGQKKNQDTIYFYLFPQSTFLKNRELLNGIRATL